jgi:ParB family transcriptional regulator, chromosome partitioning protein
MNETQEQPSRMELIKQRARDGQLGRTSFAQTGTRTVSIDKIVEDPKNERKTFANLEELVESIREVGIVEPPTVFQKEGGTYQLITGHRRFRAARIAGLQQIEIIVKEPDEERRIRLKSIVSNVQRENVNPVEMAEALQSLLDDGAVTTQAELAKVIGKHETWVSHMLKILNMKPAVRRRLQSADTSIPYDAVMKIARVRQESDQKDLISLLLKGATVKQVREQVAALQGKRPPEAPKPKQAFAVEEQGTVVVIQSTDANLDMDRVVASLRAALAIAEARLDVVEQR